MSTEVLCSKYEEGAFVEAAYTDSGLPTLSAHSWRCDAKQGATKPLPMSLTARREGL